MNIQKGLFTMLFFIIGLMFSGCGFKYNSLEYFQLTPQDSYEEIAIDFYVLLDAENIEVSEASLQSVERIIVNPLKPTEFCEALAKYQNQLFRELAREWKVGASWGFAYQATRQGISLQAHELTKLEKQCTGE